MTSVTFMPARPTWVESVETMRSLLPNSRASSTTPVTEISPKSGSMATSTLWAGMLAILPCRP